MTKATDTQATEKPVVVKDTKNNVTRPSAGTATGKVWEICDTLYAQATAEQPITRARVIKAAEAEGVNVSTAATQYGRWRTYMGLGREQSVAVKNEGAASAKKSTKKAKNSEAVAEAAAPVVEGDVETSPATETAETAETAEPAYLAGDEPQA